MRLALYCWLLLSSCLLAAAFVPAYMARVSCVLSLGLHLSTLLTVAIMQASTAAAHWHMQNTVGHHALVQDLLHRTAYS